MTTSMPINQIDTLPSSEVVNSPDSPVIPLSIDDKKIQVPYGITILEAARQSGIDIPTLCNHPDLPPQGACRVCVVEIDGEKTLQASCEYQITRPITVHTYSPSVIRARQQIIDLIFSRHYGFWDYQNCPRTGNCELQAIAKYGNSPLHYGAAPLTHSVDQSSYSIVRDMNKCILCFRCVRTCSEIQGVNCLEPIATVIKVKQLPGFLMQPDWAAMAYLYATSHSGSLTISAYRPLMQLFSFCQLGSNVGKRL